MRILITGDRNFADGRTVLNALREVQKEVGVIEYVVHGKARGADTLGGLAALSLGIPVHSEPADWQKYGRAAGLIRNQKMLDKYEIDLVLAFHDNIEQSKGTKDMITRAKRKGIPVRLYKSEKR